MTHVTNITGLYEFLLVVGVNNAVIFKQSEPINIEMMFNNAEHSLDSKTASVDFADA